MAFRLVVLIATGSLRLSAGSVSASAVPLRLPVAVQVPVPLALVVALSVAGLRVRAGSDSDDTAWHALAGLCCECKLRLCRHLFEKSAEVPAPLNASPNYDKVQVANARSFPTRTLRHTDTERSPERRGQVDRLKEGVLTGGGQ